MEENFDIDLHPGPSLTTEVSRIELDSLNETLRQTCKDLHDSKLECRYLNSRIDELEGLLEIANTDLRRKSGQLNVAENDLLIKEVQLNGVHKDLVIKTTELDEANKELVIKSAEVDEANRELVITSIQLDEANKELVINSTQLDAITNELMIKDAKLAEEAAGNKELFLQLVQQMLCTHVCVLHAQTATRRTVESNDHSTQTQRDAAAPTEQDPTQPAMEVCESGQHKDTATETRLREELSKMKAINDMVLMNNKSMERQIAKLKSKLRILSMEDQMDGDIGLSSSTVRKQGRFMIHRWIECEQCHQAFSSPDEVRSSICQYHPKQAVPQDCPDGKRLYFYLCCNKLVKNKGDVSGCCKGKHFLKTKHCGEE